MALMDNNNWRPTPPGGEPNMETPDWRTQLQPDSRQRIVNEIIPHFGRLALAMLWPTLTWQEKIYTAATNQSDYLQRISLKMLSMESKSQSTLSNSLQPNSGGTSNKPPDPGDNMEEHFVFV
ncbi:hypothetical protein Ddye_019192 [Dipteronia dyeriana]|uniref:Mediator complex subunit 15 KIX domain-containing protein n=1 Tax=Dipteronia dyeriana TaxID=168575 RepID=A0AAD9WVH4_9ROSI|nr:hypothetical protein Ddye_019192 [Dipteronia dyeriana]